MIDYIKEVVKEEATKVLLREIAARDDEIAKLKEAIRRLLDGINDRYPTKNSREWSCPHMQVLDDMTYGEVSHKRPTLTDEEREAVERLCEAVTDYAFEDRKVNGEMFAAGDDAAVAVTRALLERLK